MSTGVNQSRDLPTSGSIIEQPEPVRPEEEDRSRAVQTAPTQEVQRDPRNRTPSMSPPDPRPPSVPSPIPPPVQFFSTPSFDSVPSMPNLTIPPVEPRSAYIPPSEEGPQYRTPPPETRQPEMRQRDVSPRSQAPLYDETPVVASPLEMPQVAPEAAHDAAPEAAPETDQEAHERKHVSFAAAPEFQEAPKPNQDSTSDPRSHSHSHSHSSRSSHNRDRDRDEDHSRRSNRRPRDRHYDAGDDFSDDTPQEDHRRRSRGGSRDDYNNRDRRRSDRDRDRDSGASSTRRSGHHSPGSDDTEELPARFDEHGRRKNQSQSVQDDIAGKLDEILGSGGSSKLLGDVFGGIFGSQDGSGRSSPKRRGSRH